MATDPVAVAMAAIQDCIATQQQLLGDEMLGAVVEAARLMSSAVAHGGKVLLFGNGGSATDAAHIAAEFVGRFQRDRRPLAALSLCDNQSAVTAIANDFGFEQVFARQLEGLGHPGDVVVAISTSGDSPNVLAAVETAHRLGITTIGLSGGDGGRLADAVNLCLLVPARSTARIQESHVLIAHVLCELVEGQLT